MLRLFPYMLAAQGSVWLFTGAWLPDRGCWGVLSEALRCGGWELGTGGSALPMSWRLAEGRVGESAPTTEELLFFF